MLKFTTMINANFTLKYVFIFEFLDLFGLLFKEIKYFFYLVHISFIWIAGIIFQKCLVFLWKSESECSFRNISITNFHCGIENLSYLLHSGAFCQFPLRWIYYCHSAVVTPPERKLAKRTSVYWFTDALMHVLMALNKFTEGS